MLLNFIEINVTIFIGKIYFIKSLLY